MTNTVNQGNIQTTPVGNTNRGILAQWFGAKNIAREDFERSEQSANNQFIRDMYMQQQANDYNSQEAEKARKFNASEAEKQRAYDREMSNTQYQRAIADLKKAGLSPVLAFGGSGASFHGSSSASSGSASASSARSSGSNYVGGVKGDSSFISLIGTILNIGAGMYTAGASNATKLKVAETMAKKKGQTFNFNFKKK